MPFGQQPHSLNAYDLAWVTAVPLRKEFIVL